MGCDNFRLWTSLRSDCRLGEAQEIILSSHLEDCLSCRDFALQLMSWKTLLQCESACDPDEPFIQRVLEAAKDSLAAEGVAWNYRVIVAPTLLAIIITVFVILMGYRGPVADESPKAVRDRIWMLFTQVIHECHQNPESAIDSVRQELGASGLTLPVPASCSAASGLLERLMRASGTEPMETQYVEELRRDIRQSGLLDEWKPGSLASHREGPPPAEVQQDPFRTARWLVYSGRTPEALFYFRWLLSSSSRPERVDDILFWIAFLESLRGRIGEALGAFYSLLAAGPEWLDTSTCDQAQRLAMTLADLDDPGHVTVPMWITPTSKGPPQWEAHEISPDEVWCEIQSHRQRQGGRRGPMYLEFQGVKYRFVTLADLQAQSPEAVRFLERKMPRTFRFLQSGLYESP